jgi:hypothetical protein
MIKLVNLLKEITEGKQVGTLYHFTTLKGALGILTSKRIRTNEDGVVSATRDKNLNAAEFDTEGEADKNIVRIDLDGNKISNRYKIKPYSFGHIGKENLEFEEQIITKNDGLSIEYITNIKIIINNKDEYSYKYFDSLIKIIQEKNIPYEIKNE